MMVLLACEESQEVCREFRRRGHEAYSCDVLPAGGGHPEPSGHECVPGECPLNVRHDLDHIDRERLLAIATTMAADSVRSVKQGDSVSPVYILHAARDIAEACGETFGSIRIREALGVES